MIFFMKKGIVTTLKELKDDVKAAREKGLIYAFTPDTVETLINKIEELDPRDDRSL